MPPHRIPALIGSFLLIAGGVLHIVLGYPFLLESLAPVHLGIAGAMKSVWLGEGILFAILGAIAWLEARSPAPARAVLAFAAIAPLACSLLVIIHVHQVLHPAVIIFTPAGLALLLAALKCPPKP